MGKQKAVGKSEHPVSQKKRSLTSSKVITTSILFVAPLINIFVWGQMEIYPSHDTWNFVQRLYVISESLRTDFRLPLFFPNLNFGTMININIESISLESLPTILLASIFKLSPTTLFSIYYATSLWILMATWNFIFRSFGVSGHMLFCGLLMLSTINFPLWQINFNYQIFFQVTYALTAFLVISNRHVKHRVILFLTITFVFIPLGHNFYISIVVLYIELLLLLINPPRSLLKDTRILISDTLLFLPYLCLFAIYIKSNWDLISSELLITSPGGRNTEGNNDLETFLTYGGQSGLGKYLSLFGNRVPGSRDFVIFSNSLTVGVFIYVLTMKSEQLKLTLLRTCIYPILFLFIFTLPIKPIASIIYFLPGASYVRHLAYFAVCINAFTLLMTMLVLQGIQLRGILKILVITFSSQLFIWIALREKINLIIAFTAFSSYMMFRFLSRRKKRKKLLESKIGKDIIVGTLLITNLVAYYMGSPINESKYPLSNIYSLDSTFRFGDVTVDALARKYTTLAKLAPSAQYTFVSSTLKIISCEDFEKLFRSDLEPRNFDKSGTKKICDEGGAVFWKVNSMGNVERVKANFEVLPKYNKTRINYSISDFDRNAQYFVQLAENISKYRGEKYETWYYSKYGTLCGSCIVKEITNPVGSIAISVDKNWEFLNNAFYLITTLLIVLFGFIIMIRFYRKRFTVQDS